MNNENGCGYEKIDLSDVPVIVLNGDNEVKVELEDSETIFNLIENTYPSLLNADDVKKGLYNNYVDPGCYLIDKDGNQITTTEDDWEVVDKK